MAEHVGFREKSRCNWGRSDGNFTNDDMRVGALLRIADAVEKMASSYDSLREDRDRFKRWFEQTRADADRLARANASLRGHLKRAKRTHVKLVGSLRRGGAN